MSVCAGCRQQLLKLNAFITYGNGRVRDGVISCQACARWYPTEDGLLEFLVEPLGYADDRERFPVTYDAKLRATGLDPRWRADAVDRSEEILHQQEHFDWYANTTA